HYDGAAGDLPRPDEAARGKRVDSSDDLDILGRRLRGGSAAALQLDLARYDDAVRIGQSFDLHDRSDGEAAVLLLEGRGADDEYGPAGDLPGSKQSVGRQALDRAREVAFIVSGRRTAGRWRRRTDADVDLDLLREHRAVVLQRTFDTDDGTHTDRPVFLVELGRRVGLHVLAGDRPIPDQSGAGHCLHGTCELDLVVAHIAIGKGNGRTEACQECDPHRAGGVPYAREHDFLLGQADCR